MVYFVLRGVVLLNILIFSVSIGNGHDQVAHTIKDAFIAANPSNKVKIINTISLISPLLDKVILDSYLNILKFYPRAWGKIYEKTNKLDPIIDINDITNKITSSRLKKPTLNFEPDIIFCTHSFPASIITNLKEKRIINCPLITIVTDYNIHSTYINDYTDYYVIHHESLMPNMEAFGVQKEKILPFGIPIKMDFSTPLDKKQILYNLGLKNKKNILVMGGGLGLGAINGIVNELDKKLKDIQIIAIAGRNERLEAKLKNLRTANDLKVYGFINNVHELMEISDCIITKPGGVTCAEILAKQKPLIIFSPLPGQESDNAEFLLNYGVAVTASGIRKIPLLINQILNLEVKINSMKEISSYLKKPNATLDLINFVTKKYS